MVTRKFYSENAVDFGKAARRRWASAVDAALSTRWHQLWLRSECGGGNKNTYGKIGLPVCCQSNFDTFCRIESANKMAWNGAREGKSAHHRRRLHASSQVNFRHSHCKFDLRERTE